MDRSGMSHVGESNLKESLRGPRDLLTKIVLSSWLLVYFLSPISGSGGESIESNLKEIFDAILDNCDHTVKEAGLLIHPFIHPFTNKYEPTASGNGRSVDRRGARAPSHHHEEEARSEL